MGYATPTLRPTQAFEVVNAVHARVLAIAALTARIPAAQIYRHRMPAVPSNTGWKRACVRQPRDMVQPMLNAARSLTIPVDVLIEVHEDVEEPDWFIAQAHDVIFQGLVGQSLTLTRGDAPAGVLEGRQPTPAMYDADDHSYYSVCTYQVPVLGVST